MFIESQPTHRKPSRVQTTGVAPSPSFCLTHLVNMDCVQRSGLPTAQMTALHLDLSDSGERPRHSRRWIAAPTRSAHVRPSRTKVVFYPNEMIDILPLVTGSQWLKIRILIGRFLKTRRKKTNRAISNVCLSAATSLCLICLTGSQRS